MLSTTDLVSCPPTAPLLLALDGNSLLHRAYHAAATGRLVDPLDRPVWAIKGLLGYVARAAARLRPDAVLVGFDCPKYSVRKDAYPRYKAQRGAKPAELAEQILDAPEVLRAAGICTVVPTAYEADDVLASSTAYARRHGWRSVLVTSDRDAYALLDESTSVLRIRNGGFDEAVLVTAAALPELCGVRPEQYQDFAALRGDPADNLGGADEFGAVTAAKLLAAFGSVDAAWAALDAGDHEAVRAVVGDRASASLSSATTREIIDRNRRLMRMRADLPMPDLDRARLPIDLPGMRRALRERGILLGPSLWALTGGDPPGTGPGPAPVRQRWVISKGVRGHRRPTPGQLALF